MSTTSRFDPSKRTPLNPLLKWLFDLLSMFSGNEISIPSEFRDQCAQTRLLLQNDVSGLINSTLDFAINCSLVDYNIETGNQNLSKILNDWLSNINSTLIGRVPIGINALAKEYFRERWKGGSLLLLRSQWREIEGFYLPEKLWFLNGENIIVEDKIESQRIIGEEKYYVKINDKIQKPLPTNKDELIFVQKPYSSWSELYPIPFLIQRGLFHNLKFLELMSNKSEKIVGKALEYLLILKKGTEQLTINGDASTTYSDTDLKEIKENFRSLIANSKVENGVPTHVTNFDTEFEHFIPDYTKAINSGLYAPLEKRILQGLGLIEIVEGTSSSRKESILNPKPFIAEVNQGIKDFKSLLFDIIQTIIQKNAANHKKYMNESIDINSTPIKHFMTDTVRDHLRSLYDRGLLSKQTAIEVLGDEIDFSVELQRRKNEKRDGIEKDLYPHIIRSDESKEENIPSDKKGLEKKNYKASEENLIISEEDIIETESLIEKGKIVKEKDGYHVISKEGKNLGGPYKTYKQALKRLKEVEYFKHQGEDSNTEVSS